MGHVQVPVIWDRCQCYGTCTGASDMGQVPVIWDMYRSQCCGTATSAIGQVLMLHATLCTDSLLFVCLTDRYFCVVVCIIV